MVYIGKGYTMTVDGKEGVFIPSEWFDIMADIYNQKAAYDGERRQYFEGKRDLMKDCKEAIDELKSTEKKWNYPVVDIKIKVKPPEICPHCGSALRFDVHDSKKHCDNCGKIWTFETDLVNGTVSVREWIVCKIPEPVKGHKYYVSYPDGAEEITEAPKAIKDNMLAKHYIDLTEMFGAGNEPKDTEAFKKMFAPSSFYYYEIDNKKKKQS